MSEFSRSGGSAARVGETGLAESADTLGSVVIPFRASPSRLHALRVVLDHLAMLPFDDVIVVEVDGRPSEHLRSLLIKARASVRPVFLRDDGPFPKSWAVNVGFRLTRSDVVSVVDADLLVSERAWWRAAQEARSHGGVVRLFDRVVDLEEHEVPRPRDERWWRALAGRASRPGTNVAGGAVLFDAESFVRVGGFDERFAGWGGEDDALAFHRLPACAVPARVMDGSVAAHVHHARSSEDGPGRKDYSSVLDLLAWYEGAAADDIRSRCEADAACHGALESSIPWPRGDHEAFREALGERESSNDYTVENGWGCLGRYQFSRVRLCDLGLTRAVPGGFDFADQWSVERFLASPSVQDLCFDLHVRDLSLQLTHPDVAVALRAVDSVSLSGIVAGAHLVGVHGVMAHLIHGTPVKDEEGTPVEEYVERFSGYELPAGLERLADVDVPWRQPLSLPFL